MEGLGMYLRATALSIVRETLGSIRSISGEKKKVDGNRMQYLRFLMGRAGAERTSVTLGPRPYRRRYACARTAASLPEVEGLH